MGDCKALVGMDWQGITGLIGAIAAFVALFLNFRQESYNREKEYELRRREEEDKAERAAMEARAKQQRNEIKQASQIIFRELNRLFNNTEALRAYIVQPHPLDKAKFISVQYEVLAEGMTSVLEQVQRMPISNVCGFVSELSSRDYVVWATQQDVKDSRARVMMHNFGTDRMAAARMMDGEVWVGNIVLDFDEGKTLEPAWLKEQMRQTAEIIKYKLPEIEE